ncbi:uncharacterized protein [Amphiura filiformis]|uniref:uncharacterized protein n=1 Tax=Amphiura filiformis TaxID=82378 RepID=UPI003B223131
MLLYSILFLFVGCALGCHPTASPPGEAPRFEVHHDPIADIWLGELEFVNLFCGTGRIMPSIFTNTLDTVGQAIGGLFRRSANPAEVNPADLTPEELNRYKLDHSLLYFRGRSYEWGAGMFMRSFINGTINRNPVNCGSGITWTLQGRSNCTVDQAMQMAHSYHRAFGEYALLLNNCHIFVERFIEKLINGHCEPFPAATPL